MKRAPRRASIKVETQLLDMIFLLVKRDNLPPNLPSTPVCSKLLREQHLLLRHTARPELRGRAGVADGQAMEVTGISSTRIG